jgi:hypothetical protein
MSAGEAPVPDAKIPYATIDEAGMREWLTYLSSDQLQGRQVFTEGYGLAAAYVADHLRQWGLKPLGDDGTYFQTVKLRGYRVTRNSSVTVEVNGESRTFRHGDHVTFPANGGGKQKLSFTGFEFMGSSVPSGAASSSAPGLKGKLAVWMNTTPPTAAGGAQGRGGNGGGRGGNPGASAIQRGASAVIGFAQPPAPANAAGAQNPPAQNAQQQGRGAGQAAGAAGGRGGRGAAVQPDVTTVQRVDGLVTPQFTADPTFFEFLFGSATTKFADLKAMADRAETLAPFTVPDVKITIDIDNTFDVVTERLTRNVVGMTEGADPQLKDTYILFGAHLDHVGYSENGGSSQPSPGGCRRRGTAALAALQQAGKTPQNPGRGGAGGGVGRGNANAGGAPAGGRGTVQQTSPPPFDERDIISNGADDDGSGSTAELAVAKAFATGPKPKRSVVFVWHSGEEAGLYGSRYNADYPIVPLEKVQTQLNMDMVGRDDCNDLEGDYTNTLFIVGADRISTDLHNVIVQTNNILRQPLTLDYELNDPADPESVYTRSDHYSYASKGIPIAFFTTGLHPDYHRVTDTVDKILFPKMARIAQLVYEVGFTVANTDRVLERDNKGPRAGFGAKAELITK